MYPPQTMGQQAPAAQLFQPVQANMLVPNLPHRPPFVPNIQCPLQLQGHLPYATGSMMNEIQRLANNNQARLALFWSACQNGWQNEMFLGMVGSIIDYVEMVVATYGQQYSVEQLVVKAAADVAKGMSSTLAQQHPAIWGSLSPQGQQDAVNAANAFMAIGNQIKNFQMQNARANAPIGISSTLPGMTAAGNSMQNAIPLGGGYGGVPTAGYPQQVGAYAVGQSNIMGNGSGVPTVAGSSGMRTMGSSLTTPSAATPATPTPTVPASPVLMGAPVLTGAPITHNNETVKEQHMPTVTPATGLQIDPTLLDGPFEYDGRTFVLASKSRLKPSLGTGLPWGSAYNPLEGVMLYDISTPGQIKEEFVPHDRIRNMQPYEAHETIHFLKPRSGDLARQPDMNAAREAFLQILQEQDIAAMLETQQGEQNELTTNIEKVLINKPVTIDNNILLTGVKNPIYAALVEGYMNDNDVLLHPDVPVSFHYQAKQSWTLKGEAAVYASALTTSRTWDTIRDRLLKLRPLINEAYWHELHDDLTHAVNDLVLIVFGMTMRIDSYVDDISALLMAIEKKHGVAMLEKFEGMAHHTALACLYAEDVETDAESLEDKAPEVRFVQLEDIFMLPIHSTDLVIQHHGHGAIVLERRYPELHAVLKAHFEKAASIGDPIRHTKFVTRDNKSFSAFQAAHYANTYLIAANA